MRFEYSSGLEHFKRAQDTYVRSNRGRRVRFHLQMWGLFLVGALLLAVAKALQSWGHAVAFAVLMPLAVGALSGGAVCPLLRPFSVRRMYRIFGGDPKIPRRVYLEVEGDTLISGIEDKSEGRFQRASICDTAEDEAMLLLLLGEKRFLYLPKSAIPLEGLEAVREWLRRPGAPKTC